MTEPRIVRALEQYSLARGGHDEVYTVCLMSDGSRQTFDDDDAEINDYFDGTGRYAPSADSDESEDME